MNDILQLSLAQVKKLLDEKKVSSEEVTRASLDRINEKSDLNNFITVCEKEALAKAREVDGKRSRGESVGALAGVPIAVKDNISTKGIRTTCASKFLENYVPPYNAFVVDRLNAADAVIVGKTNMDEFAMGSTNENSAFGLAKNAVNPLRVTGGSSGGSASCVAANQVFASLGSDTGGSIRQPAAYCGVVGLKPTYSVVSRFGLVAFASSLDQIGTLTRTSLDAGIMLDVISGHDSRDTTSAENVYANYAEKMQQTSGSMRGVRIGIAREFFSEALDGGIKASIMSAAKTYEAAGATLVDTSIQSFKAALATYYVLSSAEAATNLARFDGVKYGARESANDITELYTATRTKYFGDEVKRRIMIGNYVLSSGYYDAYYLKALKIRTLIKNDFNKAFESCDALLCPVAPSVAPKIGAKQTDKAQIYLSDIYTVPVNIAALPAISLPCGKMDGMPVGMQLIGKAYDEVNLLKLALAYENLTK